MAQIFNLEGMACSHCKARVEKAAAAVAGVSTAVADLAAHTLTVEGTAENAAVASAVSAAGYPCSPK